MTILRCVEPAEAKGEDKHIQVAGPGDELIFPHVDVCIAVACVLSNGTIVGGHIPYMFGDETKVSKNPQRKSARRVLEDMSEHVGTKKVAILITLSDKDHIIAQIVEEIATRCKPKKRLQICKWVEGGVDLHLRDSLIVARPFKYQTEVIYQCHFDHLKTEAEVEVTRDKPVIVQGQRDRGRSCCHITTATCTSLGLPDDCDELTTLRWFRDEVLLPTEAGRQEVAAYYEEAPAIVAAIDRTDAAPRVYRAIYRDGIAPAVAAIKRSDFPRAHVLLRELIAGLRRRYCSN